MKDRSHDHDYHYEESYLTKDKIEEKNHKKNIKMPIKHYEDHKHEE